MSERTVEMVVEGRRGWAEGFVEGFLRGRGRSGEVIDAESEGFRVEGLREKMRGVLRPSRDTVHLLVPATLAADVRAAVEAAAASGASAAVLRERALAGARFSFSLRVCSRGHAGRIRGLFETLPDGVALSPDTTFHESVHPDDRGVELYAPAHEYELLGEGAVEGEVAGVVAVYRRCRSEELIAVEPAELVPAEGP